MPEESLEQIADRIASGIRETALKDAMQVCTTWMETQVDSDKSTNIQMALVIAQVTRVTASKIRDGIYALIDKPQVEKSQPRWIAKTCGCGWGQDDCREGCPQGKTDGTCTIWVHNENT